MKVVINSCYGSFNLSEEARARLKVLGMDFCKIASGNLFDPEFRKSKELLQVISELGVEKASGPFAKLKVVEIPDNIEFVIHEFGGEEQIAEKYRTWD